MMDSKELVQFRGLMAPVFTPFSGETGVNYSHIKHYAEHLHSKGLRAVLVNGTTGEGTAMKFDERKEVITLWKEACSKLGMLLMVQVGGGPMVEVIDLARHCTDMKVDGVLLLPDLYFKPRTCKELTNYMIDISFHCSSIPIYYYHIPAFTGVNLPMDEFMELCRRQLPAFAGIKYTSGDMEMAVKCQKHGQVFIGCDTILVGALALGFKNAIMTSLNIHPEISFKIVELMKEGKVSEARKEQRKLNEFINTQLNRSKTVKLWCRNRI